jgi:hypothetical protein
MDEKEFKHRAARLEEIATLLEKLPTEVRAAAFDFVKGYVAEPTSQSRKHTNQQNTGAEAKLIGNDEDDEAFFGKFPHDKPADNARLIAGDFFRKYGSEPFSVEEVRQRANNMGLTIPDRVDMTFDAAQEKGKQLFTGAGRGKFRPTVHGEAYLKSTYSIRKGTMTKPKAINDAG